jgi:hypothetical protein
MHMGAGLRRQPILMDIGAQPPQPGPQRMKSFTSWLNLAGFSMNMK